MVLVYGDFDGTFEVKELGVRIRIRPGDIILLRGAALRHKAGRWKGKGRMVIVPFGDRRLFAAEHIRRPRAHLCMAQVGQRVVQPTLTTIFTMYLLTIK
jgi:hypothetical protein